MKTYNSCKTVKELEKLLENDSLELEKLLEKDSLLWVGWITIITERGFDLYERI